MKRVVNAVFLAAVAAGASWLFRQIMNEQKSGGRLTRKPVHVESWENEGGALAPQHVAVETSQVPR